MKVDLKDILDSTQIILISVSEKHNLIQNKILLELIIIILSKKMEEARILPIFGPQSDINCQSYKQYHTALIPFA